MSNVIDGKLIANKIKQDLKNEIVATSLKPTLAVILVGDDPASKVYVRNKQKACDEIGINSKQITLSAETTEAELISQIVELNNNDDVNGILVQLPLPKHINTDNVISVIDPRKDVDGFTRDSKFTPCTPKGIMKLLDSISNYELQGKTALVIGRSDIVGKPVAKLLLNRDCTVIQAHSKTPKHILLELFDMADIVVSAVGKANFIKMLDFNVCGSDKVLLDVGVNRDNNGKLCGDIEEDFKREFSYYTTVPGGVGPMTIAMLLENTVEAAKFSENGA